MASLDLADEFIAGKPIGAVASRSRALPDPPARLIAQFSRDHGVTGRVYAGLAQILFEQKLVFAHRDRITQWFSTTADR